jgi:hypothetical protein
MRNNPPYKAWRLTEERMWFIGPEKDVEYPLFPDDELHLVKKYEATQEGVFTKVAPGIAVTNIIIPLEKVEEYTETRTWEI